MRCLRQYGRRSNLVTSAGRPANTRIPLPVVSPDQLGTPSLLLPIQAFRWFIEYGGRHESGWLNYATRVVPSDTAPYSPYLCTPHVNVPALMMVAHADEMASANRDVARVAFDLLTGPEEWHDIDGGHFGLLYHPSSLFDHVSSIQADFLARHLRA